jgi:hypothetical protein
MAATSINCLAITLKELGWSYIRLIAELRRQAAIDGVVLPKTGSLIPRISRWVNNHQQPDDLAWSRSAIRSAHARAEGLNGGSISCSTRRSVASSTWSQDCPCWRWSRMKSRLMAVAS